MTTLSASFTHVIAVVGRHSIIDAINPETGKTYIYGKTLEEVRQDEPAAMLMTWSAWQAEQIARQESPLYWSPTDEPTYRRMLECLPPAAWIGGAFLVGEPEDHCYRTGQPRFRAYRHHAGKYEQAGRPMTIAEFRRLSPSIPLTAHEQYLREFPNSDPRD